MGIELLPTIWPDWQIVEQIGEGGFGKVYKAVRQDSELTTYAAIKVITVPKSDSEIESLRAEGMSESGAKTYLQGIVSDFINEIKLMESMKGTSNIVSVEDYKVIEKKDGIGWDIFIRMELLTPFVRFLADNQSQFTEKDVAKLGMDICSALELCARKNVIHRDIKPENIFISSFGDYKIGDFGIAKQLEKTSSALSSKGTFNYMAPEVAVGKKYDATVDIYSLGIVLYKLLNNNRLPFIDPHAEQLQYSDRKIAVDRRLSGEALPAPVNASARMTNIILTACAHNPKDRFATPAALKNALSAIAAANNFSSAPQQKSTAAAGFGAERSFVHSGPNNGETAAAMTNNKWQQSGNTPVTGNFQQRTVPTGGGAPLNNSYNNSGAQNGRVGYQTPQVINNNSGYYPPQIQKRQSEGSGQKNSNRSLFIIIALIAVVAIAIILIAYSASAANAVDEKLIITQTVFSEVYGVISEYFR